MSCPTLDSLIENKASYIGKVCRHNDGDIDILKDIYIAGKDMVWFIMENKNHSCSGIKEIISLYEYKGDINVNIRYCGNFSILSGV